MVFPIAVSTPTLRWRDVVVTFGFGSQLIHAPASRIFDLLADPRQHARLDGSGSVSSVKNAPNV